MDFQPFSSPQHPPAFGGAGHSAAGFSSSSAPTHSPSPQTLLYADPQARLRQSNPPFPYAHPQAPFANGQPAGGFPPDGGAVMPLAGLSQSQLHHARAQQSQQHLHPPQPSPSPYSSAPFAQPLASPAHPPFAHGRQTASPPNAPSASSTPVYASHPQRSPSVSAPSHPHAQSMNPPAAATPMAMTPAKQVPPSPVSPGAQAREKARIDTLLEINQALIQEVMELHSQGKAGHIGPAPEKADGEKQQQPSMEYRDCMRRLQANLAFLATNAEKHTKPNQAVMPGPAIMNPPASPETLVVLYNKLRTLFPGWSGAQAKASPGPQRLNSTSSQPAMPAHMQPPNSAGLHNNMNMGMQPPGSAGLPPGMQLPSNANAGAMNHLQQGLPSQ